MSSFKPKFNNLVEVFENSVEKFADQPLFGTKQNGQWVWMTYGEFGEKVDKMRAGLASLGVGKGDVVAIIANNRPEWAIAAYATYGVGGFFVPMYESMLPKDWKYILDDCGAKALVVSSEEIRDQIAGIKGDLPKLESVITIDGAALEGGTTYAELVEGDHPAVESIKPDGSDTAGLIYTSGTTGNPKGVILSHANFSNNVSAIHEIFPMSPADRSLSFLPWAHSFGQTVELHGMFSMGASMGIAESVPKIVDNLGEVKPTLLIAVPRIFNRIYDGLQKRMNEAGGLKKSLFDAAIANANYRKKLEAERRRSGWADFKHGILDKLVFSKVRERFGGELKYAFSGGAALGREVAEFIDNLGIMVYEGYGLTETSPITTANCPSGRKIGSVGRPIPGVRVEIDTAVTGDPVQGEIVIYGHNVMQGYFNNDAETEKVSMTGPDGEPGFRSGDMGFLDGEGFLSITGRIKEQYKLLNGKYVVPTPLEEKIKLSPFVANIMVHGANQNFNIALVIPDFETLEKWAADHGIATDDKDALLANDQVMKKFEEELANYSSDFKQYEKVKKITFGKEDFSTENGMLTPSMKVKRRIVLKEYGDQIEALYK